MICALETPLLSDAESRSTSDAVAVTVTVSLTPAMPSFTSTGVS